MPFLQFSGFLGLEMQKGIVINPVPTAFNDCFQAFWGRSKKKYLRVCGQQTCEHPHSG
jgi:hypothetical protein